jgi:Histidine kinase/Histidine kinase-, DNA gyrase B-, and HSP90-like ATPase
MMARSPTRRRWPGSWPPRSAGMCELDVVTDRDRIVRDLHDHVIQRLFAVGLALQATVPRTRDAEVRRRLTEAVDDLHGVIQEIRTTIFDLHAGITRLRQRIDDAVAQFAGSGLRTTVQYVGPLSVVDGTLADHAEAVVREALSNAVRHAGATTVTVRVAVDDDLSIEVSDYGRGMPEGFTGSGLTNLRWRGAGRRSVCDRKHAEHERNNAAMGSTAAPIARDTRRHQANVAFSLRALGWHSEGMARGEIDPIRANSALAVIKQNPGIVLFAVSPALLAVGVIWWLAGAGWAIAAAIILLIAGTAAVVLKR